jgi:UDP-N-acetylmuramoylalanine--D-glutamate ligase
MTYDFDRKVVAVLGMARSGMACADVLTALGAQVRLYDQKPAEALGAAVSSARALGIEPKVGGAPVDYDGLDALITSPGVPKTSPVLQDAVARGVPVWSEIEAAYQVALAPILAVTGTNGKTTTAVLLGEMLRAAGRETFVAGNITAGAIAMPLIKAAHEASPEAAIVAEISSFQLEWIEAFRPKIAALLNITPDHGDRQTWEEYVAAKWRIFENQTADDFAVLPSDLSRQHEREMIASRLLVFGGPNMAQSLQVLCPQAQVKLPGSHNVENILAAAAMATAFGVGRYAICKTIETFAGVVHRLEYVATIDGIRFINNSMCTNAAAFQKSLDALPETKVVIAGGVYKGSDLGLIAQAVVGSSVRAVVLIGKSAPEIERALNEAGFPRVFRAGSLPEAVSGARALAETGDAVMLAPACASFDMFRDFEDRGDQFKAAVRKMAEQPG